MYSLESLAGSRFSVFASPAKTGMISQWLLYVNASVFLTHTGSPVSARWSWFGESSVTRRRASSRSCGAQKTVCKICGRAHSGWYDRTTRRAHDLSCGNTRVYLEFEVRRILCRCCGKVKRERLDFLADNPFYARLQGKDRRYIKGQKYVLLSNHENLTLDGRRLYWRRTSG